MAIDIHGNQTVRRREADFAGRLITETVTSPGASTPAVETSYNGRRVTSAAAGTGAVTVFAHDALGRVVSVEDPRHTRGSVTTYEAGSTRVSGQTDGSGATTTFEYPPNGAAGAGKVRRSVDPVGQTVRYGYDLQGRVIQTWGTASYLQRLTYDAYGALATLTTWRDAGAADLNAASWPAPAGGDTTSWTYEAATGLLTRKAYADGNGTDYTYTPANQLYRRLWTRTVASARVTTEYAYDAATGELTSINYSDATPDVTFTYDRLGRPATVVDGSGTRTFGYSATTLQPVTETFGAAYFGSRILTYLYQGSGAGLVPGRAGGYRLGTSGLPGQDLDVAHTYDTAGRLAGVTSGAGTFTYGYLTDSPLLSGVSGPQATTTYAYEPDRDLRTEVLNKVGSTIVSRYGYRSDAAGRRKDRVQEGTAFTATTYDRFGYSPRGEVTQSKNFTGTNPDAAADPENTALARLYGYDVIGNRLTSTVGTGTARVYTSNALNQYTAITNPAATPAHDLDGNQTVTGTGWHYEWDAENRLSLTRDYATSPVNGSKKVEYTYDYRSRRIRKIESTYTAGAWAVADDRKFLYEGWNLLGEFATNGFARICAYTWGLDLSQTAQGAGGVGGLGGSVPSPRVPRTTSRRTIRFRKNQKSRPGAATPCASRPAPGTSP